MAKRKLKVGGRYRTNDKRLVTMTADQGEIIERLADGEDRSQPMSREAFEAWIVGTTAKKKRRA